jgi:hypothetical protein
VKDAYLVASLARASAEAQFNDMLSDAERKARNNVRDMAQKEQATYQKAAEFCAAHNAHPGFIPSDKQGEIPTSFDCVPNQAPAKK